MLVSPELGHAPAVTVAGDELCVAGVGFDRPHRHPAAGACPPRAARPWHANADVDFARPATSRPTSASPASGVILPREDADGVGIETVNVSKLHIEVWRVPDRNLVRKRSARPTRRPRAATPTTTATTARDDEGRNGLEGRRGRAAASPSQQATTVFPLGAVLKEMKPGGYVIKARDASGRKARPRRRRARPRTTTPAQARRWMMFTDMALTGLHRLGRARRGGALAEERQGHGRRARSPWWPRTARTWPR